MWEKFVVVQLCLFGLWNTQARRHSVRSKISGTAAWWLRQWNQSWCWHSTTITNPIVSSAFARWIAQTIGSTLKYTHLITTGPVRGKMTWCLCGWKVPVILGVGVGRQSHRQLYSQYCPDFLSRGLMVFTRNTVNLRNLIIFSNYYYLKIFWNSPDFKYPVSMFFKGHLVLIKLGPNFYFKSRL